MYHVYVMKLLLRPILSILAYTLALYLMNTFGFLFGVEFLYGAQSSTELIKVYLLIGIVFWFGFSILRFMLNVLTLPIQYMTLWVVWWLTNILVMFVCQFVINFYLTGIIMNITSVAGVVISSVILWLVVSIVYWIFKKII